MRVFSLKKKLSPFIYGYIYVCEYVYAGSNAALCGMHEESTHFAIINLNRERSLNFLVSDHWCRKPSRIPLTEIVYIIPVSFIKCICKSTKDKAFIKKIVIIT